MKDVKMVIEKYIYPMIQQRGQIYGSVQPIDLLDDEEIMGIIHMKFFRAKLSKSMEVKIDSLVDLISYALMLLVRWIGDQND